MTSGASDSANLPLYVGLVVFALAVLYRLVPPRWRKSVVLFSSLGFLFAYSPAYSAFLVAQVWVCHQAARWMVRARGGARRLIFGSMVAWQVGWLALSKAWTGADWTSPAFLVLGFSYIVFRMIHYLTIAYHGQLRGGGFRELLNHVLFFPSLIAGPVLYYEDYATQRPESARLERTTLTSALLRISIGIAKKFLVSDRVKLDFVLPVLGQPLTFSPWIVAIGISTDFLCLYLDFSGYSDIAIGVARLFGYRLPENFDRPLLKPNIAAFWRSWHISLHDFIRDHFFLPVFGHRASWVSLYVGLFCTMALMTLWHAFTWGFLLLGLLHGLALAVWTTLQELKKQNRRLALLLAHPVSRACSVVLTFLFCSLSFELGFKGFDEAMYLYAAILWR